jgi:hypothetical protein
MNYYNVGPDLVESSAWWFIGGAVVGLVLGSCGMFLLLYRWAMFRAILAIPFLLIALGMLRLAHRICPELNEQSHTSAWVTTTWDGKVN